MILDGVDFPDHILSAFREKTLCLFVGAGVSMNPPSSIPGWGGLVDEIAHGFPGGRRQGEPEDRYLGRMKDAGIDVHARANERVTRPDSEPNDFHSAILGLYSRSGDLRIVTTNFDTHLEGESADFEVFSAPALPVGTNFHGLVYLHGRSGEDPRRLVVTDADYGRAYLTEGWARRFLVQLFLEYTVLFVGYSHNDQDLTYLARALPAGAKPRFALTSDAEGATEYWRGLGIEPLFYDTSLGDHSRALAAIQGLGGFLTRDALDHSGRITRLVSLGRTNLELADEQYLLHCVRDGILSRFVFEHADESWFEWFRDRGLVEDLITTTEKDLPPAQRRLAFWIVEKLVPEGYPRFAGAYIDAGRQLNPTVQSALLQRLADSRVPLHDPLPWVCLLLEAAPNASPRAMERLLDRAVRENQQTAAVLLWESMTQPRMIVDRARSFSDASDDAVHHQVQLKGEPRTLLDTWRILHVNPIPDHMRDSLMVSTETALRRAHLLSRESRGDDFDPESHFRSAIEDHEQDSGLVSTAGPLISAARDLLELYLEEDGDGEGRCWIHRWLKSDVTLLRRLAVHGVTEASFLSPDEKLQFVLENDLLFESETHHETYRLLAQAYGSAEELQRNAVLERIEQYRSTDASSPEETETRDYRAFSLATWLARSAPDADSASHLVDVIATSHPDFTVSDNLDFLRWSGGVREIRAESPLSWEEVRDLGSDDLARLFCDFDKRRRLDRPVDEWGGLLQELRNNAVSDFDIVEALADGFQAVDCGRPEVWRAILDGWSGKELSDVYWSRVLDSIERNPGFFSAPLGLGRCLRGPQPFGPPRSAPDALSRSVQLALRLWDLVAANDDDIPTGRSELLTHSLNRPEGMIAELLVVASVSDRERLGEEWKGLSEERRLELQLLVADSGSSGVRARVMLASYLHVLHALDPAWVTENLIPLFDCQTNLDRAIPMWRGFLYSGRPTLLLTDDMLDVYRSCFPHVGDLEECRARFPMYVSLAAVTSTSDPRPWIGELLSAVAVEDRLRWVQDLGQRVSEMTDEAVETVWEHWLREYFGDRATGVPPATEEEWGEMSAICIGLRPVFPEAVAFCIERESRVADWSRVYFDLESTELASTCPEETSQLLLHLLQATEATRDFDLIQKIAVESSEHGAPKGTLRAIVVEYIRLGGPTPDQFGDRLDVT